MSRCLTALSLILFSLTAGCLPVHQPDTINPAQQQAYDESARTNTPPALVEDRSRGEYEDKEVVLLFEPILGDDGWWRAFVFAAGNKTQGDMKVVWDETYFIENGKQNGRFMTRGIPHERREEPRVSDVVLSGQVITLPLWPNAYVTGYVSYPRGREKTTWTNEPFGAGEYGISLAIQTAKGKKRITLFTVLKEEGTE